MRFKLIKLIYFITTILIVLRLGYWQIIRADDLTARGEDQRLLTKEVVAPRGTVRFLDNSILASIQPSFLIYAEPKVIDGKFADKSSFEYKKLFSKQLSEILWEDQLSIQQKIVESQSSPSAQIEDQLKIRDQKIDELSKTFLDKLNQNLYWVSLGKKINFETKKKIEKLGLVGIGFEPTSERFYPEGSTSAHLLGFIGSDIYGEEAGYFGLEGFYNGELKGRRGFLTTEKDAMGLPILIGKFQDQQPKSGKTLVLNIDRAVQHMVEEKLSKAAEKYGAKGGSVIIMDPQTGGVIAMASTPGYDPAWANLYPSENFRNPITAESYEPGSTFKVLVMAAGINEGLVKGDTVCDICSSPINISGYTIKTWNNQYRPNSTMTDVIIHSDNTGMVFVSGKLGVDKMYSYIKRFGFGDRTGIDLQDEQTPPLREQKEWKEIDLATSSFGQGISVTPIQLIRAVSTIANGGKLYEPHIVSKIDDDKSHFKIGPRIIDQPISEQTAKTITDMMVKAVDLGEAQFYKKKAGLSDYKIAGKTGTAQIPVAGHYDPTKTIASFIGFAPADKPKFIMLVRFLEPSSSIFGADTAAPTFFDISKELFAYYGIAPND